jgi:actin-like ATPase involved in cell morphogenesis
MANWFSNISSVWSQDMAIDLGTANTLVVLVTNLKWHILNVCMKSN